MNDYLLQENGFLLLNEDGSRLLLDTLDTPETPTYWTGGISTEQGQMSPSSYQTKANLIW